MTIFEAKKEIIEKIKDVSASPALDADVFLQSLLGCDKTFVLMNKDLVLGGGQAAVLKKWAELRSTGLPVAYIIEKKEFYGYEFFVDKSVLIPKQDTEILVDAALETLSEKMLIASNRILTVCDMCAGSGCVGLSVLRALLDECEKAAGEASNKFNAHKFKTSKAMLPHFTLVDISAPALEVARKNAAKLFPDEKDRAKFIQSNLFERIQFKYDLIVSNPPYVPHDEVLRLLSDGRAEPPLALDGDVLSDGSPAQSTDGLEVVRRLALEARERLAPSGVLLIEVGEYNADSARDFLIAQNYKNVKIIRDLEGQKRVVCASI